MANYIDRQAALDELQRFGSVWMEYTDDMSAEKIAKMALKGAKDSLIDILNSLPSADAVEVVRCKNCRWYKTNYMWSGTEVKICAKEAYEPSRNADDFCSYGERK